MDELIEFMLICWCSSSMLMFASLLIQFNNAEKRGDKLRFDCYKSIFTHRNATNKQTMGKTIIQEMFIGLKINSRNYLIGSILLTAFAQGAAGEAESSTKWLEAFLCTGIGSVSVHAGSSPKISMQTKAKGLHSLTTWHGLKALEESLLSSCNRKCALCHSLAPLARQTSMIQASSQLLGSSV